MKSKTILGADGATKMRQITVGIHGKGGEAGIKAIQQLAGMVDSLKQCQTPQEVYDRYLQITGYCKCCVDCNFIDQKGADELMCLAAYLAGNEQARAEVQQKAGKRWNCSKNLVRPEPEYRIISDREYFKKEPKAIKGYYVDKNSVSMGVHSPEYYGYGYLRYTLVKITDRGGLKCR